MHTGSILNVELILKIELVQVLQYYESQARTNNNRGREAACHCMAELVRKLEPSAILPYLPRILKALLSAFRDDSWPVRCFALWH